MFSTTRRAAGRLLAVGLLTVLSLAASAQSVSMKGDVITVDKKPYAKLTKSGGLLKDFTLLTLDDQEVMTAKGNIVRLPSNESFVYYMMTFKPGGETAEMGKEGLNFATQLTQALVKHEVMRDGKPNPEGIARFTEAYSKKLSAQYAAENEAQKNAKPLEYKTVERNRMGGAKVELLSPRRGDTSYRIMQSGVLIGLMQPEESKSSIQKKFSVTLPDGMNIADITIYPASDGMYSGGSGTGTAYKMHVKKDNKYHDRSAPGNEAAAQRDAIEWLVSGGYL